MTTHLGLQRILLPSAQVSQLTTGSITLPSARGAFSDGAYDFIATNDVATATSSITFSSIPTTYQHLQLRYVGRNGRAADSAGFLGLQINGSYTTYLGTMYYASGAAPAGLDTNPSGSNGYQLHATGSTANASAYGTGVADFLNYNSTTQLKTVRVLSAAPSGSADSFLAIASMTLNSTSAITSISITGIDGANIIAGSKFSLYGLKAS
jgi:hypothetical protein